MGERAVDPPPREHDGHAGMAFWSVGGGKRTRGNRDSERVSASGHLVPTHSIGDQPDLNFHSDIRTAHFYKKGPTTNIN